MRDRRTMLKVKVKSLAEEARIIRREENQSRDPVLRVELARHRREIVRWHARTSHVAYGLIKGIPLEAIEKPKEPRSELFWKSVRKMVETYGPLDGAKRAETLARCTG